MSLCASDIVLLAGQIYTGLGSPPAQSIGFVSGWLTTSGNLGDLNNKLSTSFYLSGSSPCIAGDFGAEEQAVYTLSYKVNYYESASLAVLAAGGATPWVELREADTTIRRDSASNMAKAYLALQKAAQEDLWYAVANYKLRITVPMTVSAASLASFPTP